MPGNGVGNITTRFPRLKHPSRYVNQRRPSGRAARNTKWKIFAALALLLFALLAEFDGLSQPSRKAVIAVLADPLSLLSERSPGLRGAGTLLSIKGRPHERVLSDVRNRQPPIPNVVASIPIIPQQYDTTLVENPLSELPPFAATSNPPEGLFAGPPLANPSPVAPSGTMAVPEPASWTTVGGSLVVGMLVRQYVRKRRHL